ncbi:MAG: heavy metal-associated domain-containing protein [Cytophagales bacterium]|nr:heavy metal-associated domain-containing protein [Cytophagales bacterium]
MKNLLTTLCFAILLSGTALAQENKTQKAEILTSAICEMCKETIEYELTFTKGIKFVELDTDSKIVTVEFNPKKISVEDIRKGISGVGYNADSVKRDPKAYTNLPFCCRDGGHDNDH